MKNSGKTIILFCFLGLVGACGFSKEEKEVAKIPPLPYLIPWLDVETLITIQPVEKVEGSIKGRVIVCRSTSKDLCYSVEVETYKEISIGSKVKISKMYWPITRAQRAGPESWHLIITRVLPNE